MNTLSVCLCQLSHCGTPIVAPGGELYTPRGAKMPPRNQPKQRRGASLSKPSHRRHSPVVETRAQADGQSRDCLVSRKSFKKNLSVFLKLFC